MAAVSRGGKVLLFDIVQNTPVNTYVRWIYDITTGERQDAPDALGVNDSGTTVGIRPSGKDASGKCDDVEVFLRYPDGSTQSLGNPVHGDYGTLDCFDRLHSVQILDELSRPVVSWRYGSPSNAWAFFRWNGSSWDRLARPGNFIEAVTAVNDRGHFVGVGGTSAGGFGAHALLWQDAAVTEIGTFGGTTSCARGLNNADQVVGYATVTGEGNNERPFLWSAGELRELELPPGFAMGEAYAIADNGEVGGWAFASGMSSLSFHGMLWTRDRVYDVNDLIDTHDWLVTSIVGTTREGHLVAGAVNGEMEAQPVVLIRGAPATPDKSWHGIGEVVIDEQNATSLAIDGSRVYWEQAQLWSPADRQTWTIQSMVKSGGLRSVDTGTGYAEGPLVADAGLLWFPNIVCLDPPGCHSGDYAIWSLAPSGATKRIAPGVGPFALRSGVLFSKAPVDALHAAVYRTPMDSGVSQIIDTMSLTTHSGVAAGIDTDDTAVYYTWMGPDGAASVRAQPLAGAGGAARDLFPGDPRISAAGRLKVDAAFVFIQSRGEILRVPTRGGTLQQVVPSVPSHAYLVDMDVNDGHVWWIVSRIADGPNCLWRADADGSNASAIECGLHDYRSVRVDASGAYVIRDLQIVRFPK